MAFLLPETRTSRRGRVASARAASEHRAHLSRSAEGSSFSRPGVHRRARPVELLCLSRGLIRGVHRAFRPYAVGLQPGLRHERHRLHRRRAVQQLSSCGASVRSGWCAPPSRSSPLSPACCCVLTLAGVDNGFVLWGMLFVGLRLSRPRHSLDGRPRARGAWRACGNGLGADGDPATLHGRGRDRSGQRLLRRTAMSMVVAIAGCGLIALTLSWTFGAPGTVVSLAG